MCSRILFPMFLPLILPAVVLHTISLSNAITTTSSTIVAGNETDRLALLAFKSSILHDPRSVLTSWNDSLNHCQWEGVTCGKTHSRVISLDLHSNGLVGSLSPFVGNLSFLRVIDLQNNSLQGDIPPQLGLLFRLQNLTLSKNILGGEIPSTLSNCSNLILLHLGQNQLVGEIPEALGSLSKLKLFLFHFNNLTGQIPSSIGNLTSLQHLSATYNYFTGIIPDSIGQLQNLEEIDMGGNNISGIIPPSIYNLSFLSFLTLGYNQLQGGLPQSLGSMLPNLKYLQLGTNQLSGPLPPSLSNATQLQRLDFSFNNFTGKISIDFSSMQELFGLVLGGNNLGSGEPDEMNFLVSLSNCTSLLVLELAINQLRGALPLTLGNFSADLFYFSLFQNNFNGDIPSWISDLVGLTQLLLNDNEFSGTIPTSIGNLQKLQKFALDYNSIFGEVPSSIGQLTTLNELTLNNNKLQGSIPQSLGNCQLLLSLDLSVNNFSSTIPKELFNIPTLSKLLNISHNHLVGSLPAQVGNLKNLVALDVSSNELSGEFPNDLGRCTSLVSLFMEGNLFQGPIPASLSSLRGLAILDLSHNNLSGQIPQFLETFSLTSLNLSYNNFEGEVPRQGAFANSSAISIRGNTKLCGGISELLLPRCSVSEQKKRKGPRVRTIITFVIVCAVVGAILVSFTLYLFWSKRKLKVVSTDLQLKEQFINVSYEQLLKATDGFSSEKLIGTGSFCTVYKGILEQEERVVAIKVFNLLNEKAPKSFIAECEALRVVRHRNLIKILSCCSSIDFQGNDFKALLYEYMPNGSLEKWLHMSQEENNQSDSSHVLTFSQRVKIAIDVAFALDYLHNQCETPIVHCDLKPSNILLDGEMVACVGDFGLAKIISTSYQNNSSIGLRGTVGYAAPEYGLGSEVSVKGDMYSYGILVLEMMTGKRPTDPMFQEGLDLHKFAKMSISDPMAHVFDPLFVDHLTEANNNDRMEDCLSLMIKIGVSCSVDLAKNRMDIADVLKELHSLSSILNREISRGTLEAHHRTSNLTNVTSVEST